MTGSTPNRPFEALIVGGGVAALEAALTLRYLAGERARITLLTRQTEFSYLPQAVREPFSGPAARRYPLARFVDDLHLDHRPLELRSVDPVARTVTAHTHETIGYDALLLATGARQQSRFRHAINLDSRRLDEQLHGLIQDLEAGLVGHVAFVVPSTPNWPMPVYELALQTARRAYEMSVEAQVTIVTPEPAPLAAFGVAASRAVAGALAACGVSTLLGSSATVTDDGHLLVDPADRVLPADRIVALPELYGHVIPGIDAVNPRGFIRVDSHGAVEGCERVFAAGDITDFPIKQGGIAAQQAAAAAEAIAALAGVPLDPRPVRPTLSGLLIGPERPLYLRARLVDGVPTDSEVSEEPLWPASQKIAAPSLAPYLEALDQAGMESPDNAQSPAN